MESGCIACSGADHSHLTCVHVGAALHRWMLQLGPGKDMTLVVDIILRLLMWGWREARFGEEITCLSYTPGGNIISAGGRGGSIFFMSAQTGEKILCPLTGHSGIVTSVAWNNDGTKLVSGSYDETVKIWSVGSAGTFECQSTLSGHLHIVSCLAFKPDDSNILVTGSDDHTLKMWDLSKSFCLSTVTVDSTVWSVAFSPCGKTMAVGCDDGTVVIVDVATVAVMRSLNAHSDCVLAVSWSACGKWLVSGGRDTKINIYDAQTFQVKRALSGHSDW
jgi:WD40 repeat protein